MTLLFRWSPRRRQPRLSWLAFGAGLGRAVAVAHGRARLFFAVSTSFGQTYGPLAGIVALLLWALLSAVACCSAARSPRSSKRFAPASREPQDEEKVEHSEPEHEPPRPRDGG